MGRLQRQLYEWDCILDDLDLERLSTIVATDIRGVHNALLDSEARFAELSASQDWALHVLRSPSAPAGDGFDEVAQALSVGRNNLGML